MHAYIFSPDKRQKVEFYDFLQVNTDSFGSEVIDPTKKDEEKVKQDAMLLEHKNKPTTLPLLNFLSARNST